MEGGGKENDERDAYRGGNVGGHGCSTSPPEHDVGELLFRLLSGLGLLCHCLELHLDSRCFGALNGNLLWWWIGLLQAYTLFLARR